MEKDDFIEDSLLYFVTDIISVLLSVCLFLVIAEFIF